MNRMNLHLPLVSVIIPAYNAETFIDQTLNSVLSQTYTNIEVLVVDDGSQDRTAELVASIAQRDQRVILLQQSNAGVAAARNLAIEKSNGEYIAPIDADDIWYPSKIEKQVECILQAEPCVGLVYAWSVNIDEEDLIIGKYPDQYFFYLHSLEGEVYTALVYRNFVGNASVPLIRSACLKQIGCYNYKLKEHGGQGCEDWELYLRIAEYYQFRIVPEFLVGYRQVTGSMSANYRSMGRSYDLIMADVQQRHPEIPNPIYQWSGSYFYTYLIWKSYSCGNYWDSLVWLYKAFKLDFALILSPWVYKGFVKIIIKIAAKLGQSFILPDYHSSLQFKQRVKSNPQVITISDINSRINKTEINKIKRLPWRLTDRIALQRWERVVQNCRSQNAKTC